MKGANLPKNSEAYLKSTYLLESPEMLKLGRHKEVAKQFGNIEVMKEINQQELSDELDQMAAKYRQVILLKGLNYMTKGIIIRFTSFRKTTKSHG